MLFILAMTFAEDMRKINTLCAARRNTAKKENCVEIFIIESNLMASCRHTRGTEID